MSIDVTTTIDIECNRHDVARFSASPDNATRWYRNMRSIEWKTPRSMNVGGRIAFTASFLGRTLAYTYEIRENIADERLVMSTDDAQLPMETTYTWQDLPGGGTRMTLRNRGEPAGVSRWLAPLVTRAMRRANQKDLLSLKAIMESITMPGTEIPVIN